MDMTKEQRDKLRTLALAATPGEWEQKNTTDVFGPLAGDSGDGTMADSSDGWLIADCNVGLTSVNGELATMDVKIQRRNAAYIAAANPATLLTLLDRIEELEGDAERYRWIRANCLSVTDLAATRIGASDEAIDKARGQE